jgi:hypothetical protein
MHKSDKPETADNLQQEIQKGALERLFYSI